jgi:hypothetical protein
MAPLGESRRRSGASLYRFFQEGETPHLFVEAYFVPSWDEHLRQHFGRLTGADQEQERAAAALADGPPTVRHFLPVPASQPDMEPDAANSGLSSLRHAFDAR